MELPEIGNWLEIAEYIMKVIMYDNGAVNRFEPDGGHRYPEILLIQISSAARDLFTKHPEFYTQELVDEIATGGLDDCEGKYNDIPEYLELSKLLNEFFDIM